MVGTKSRIAGIVCGIVLLASPGWTQTTVRASVSTAGAQGSADSRWPCVSDDGRYVAFASLSALVPEDTNGVWDVYLRDRVAGTTERISVDSAGHQASDSSGVLGLAMSADARIIAFVSSADDLVPGDTNGVDDIFVRDRVAGTTTRITVAPNGREANGPSRHPSIGLGGNVVAFASDATNLVPGDTNGTRDVFVRTLGSGITQCVSVDENHHPANGWSDCPAISSNGDLVAFVSLASNLVPNDTNGCWDVFTYQPALSFTLRRSVDSDGHQGNADSGDPFTSDVPVAISHDGQVVAFHSAATNLVPGDTNGQIDVFVNELTHGKTERVSIATDRAEGDDRSISPAITRDGRYVVFASPASTLVAQDTNSAWDIFLRDRTLRTTRRIDAGPGGIQANQGSENPAISRDARYVVYESSATNLIPGADSNGPTLDVMVYDQVGGPSFATLCNPGDGVVTPCPCANPPSGPGRGCDNSAHTGGATLAAAGASSLSSDSLVFTTSGEKATATSILFQNQQLALGGFVFGQGVICGGGYGIRMYLKSASNGGTTAPDFSAGDPTVSVRSARNGDVIPPGGQRYYFVAYRDPVALGSCAPGTTLNATTTGQVTWSP